MKLDILAMAAHPDDAELSCSGTLVSHAKKGKKVGILDFTKGELGTRGTPELRLEEAQKSSQILGLSIRENANFRDGFFQNNETHQLQLIYFIRKYKPDIVLANAIEDRHPDHVKGALLAKEACFLSGLRKIETFEDGKLQEAWRPKNIYHYIQDRFINPSFVVDITDFWEVKKQSILAFRSQFFDPSSQEPESYISKPTFLNFIEGRMREMGHLAGFEMGEGFTSDKKIGISDLFSIS